jgi:hypothetical protein
MREIFHRATFEIPLAAIRSGAFYTSGKYSVARAKKLAHHRQAGTPVPLILIHLVQ